ncbi:MAG: DUF6691 family protein [Ginsengibacter sp.]
MENTIAKSSDNKTALLPDKKIKYQGNIFYLNSKFLLAGIVFGILLVKGEVISWFRIQEMFRLQSFHMYGIIGSAIVTGMISIFLIKKFRIKTISKEEIVIQPKKFHKGYIYGGLIFGFGWAITGACPGPLFAQIGSGTTVVIITLLSAITGTWTYGYFKDRLPH